MTTPIPNQGYIRSMAKSKRKSDGNACVLTIVFPDGPPDWITFRTIFNRESVTIDRVKEEPADA